MGELKPGWRRVKFGELAECVNDRVDDPAKSGVDRYVGLEHLDSESLTLRRWGTPDEVESTKLRFRPGDIIFGKRRAYQRKLAVADFEGICSAHAMVLRAKPGAVVPEFLPFFMQSDAFMDRAVAISVGSLSPTINWKTLAAEELALPPIEEQRRIADLMGAIAEASSSYRGAADQAARTLAAARNEYFSRGAWPSQTLEELALGKYGIVDGPFGSNLKSIHFRESGHPVISSSMVTSGRFEAGPDDYRYVDDEKFEELQRNRVHPGDVIVVLIGVNCGVSAILPDAHPPGVITQNCLKITVNPSICSRDYLLQALRWLKETGRLERLVTSTQQRALSLGRLRHQRVPIPLLSEQLDMTAAIHELEKTDASLRGRATEILAIQSHHITLRLLGLNS